MGYFRTSLSCRANMKLTYYWALVKQAVPKERALKYAEQGEEWLEGFNMGYKRDDQSTWKSQNIPKHRHGGLFDQLVALSKKVTMGLTNTHRFSFAHSQFVWDCKSEPGVRDIFAQIWGTDKLTVSYGMLR